MNERPLTASLSLHRPGEARIGQDRIRLLAAIERLGTIAGAARELGLSYKTAWDAVGTLNNLFDRPLVEAAPGGRTGGNARVTEAGRALIAGFEQLETTLAQALTTLEGGVCTAPEQVLEKLWSMTMHTSTRNTFRCTVTRVTMGPVNAEVELALTDGHHLTAVITERSAAEMRLAPGVTVFALIKASFVMLTAGGDPGRVSASNRLTGLVAARTDGPVNSEIVIDLGACKSITAVITHSSAEALGLAPGVPATALFKASHVILARP
ncbi:molybdate transport system regulatory protein [Rhodobacter aestuarii]|uniref:Molybdate transport system regulatory protein n=1 Tax=Rhodobacter aestuarii TaxID=453582 RepID=A0A1N7IYF6_9RHOB|nr:TOBE domain-containing protein [Rhodobacter aestuarii]PTV97391.1 molybdate transport system regulatory protein [Rhodobacter aestuarii]SIS42099.1 molybdate transport system regulatory protein [Rhodobacter aestuarii]